MTVYLNTISGLLTTDAAGRTAIDEIVAKRGTDFDLSVITNTDIPLDSTGVFAALAQAGGTPLALASWQAPTQINQGWAFNVSLRGADLGALFNSGAGSIVLNAEITALISGKTRKSQTILMTVYRDIYSPSATPPDAVNIRRTNMEGYQEYSFDLGATWWKYAPVVADGIPEWQWTYLGADE